MYVVKQDKIDLFGELLKSRPGAVVLCNPEDMPQVVFLPNYERGKLLATLATL